MLSNLILVILIAFTAIFSFFAGYKVFYMGFLLGKEEKKPEPVKKKSKKTAKTSQEVVRMNSILSNIEKYDGTSAGQEDIK